MPESGELTGIAVRSKSRAPMQECAVAEATTDSGIAGDFRGTGKRPVTLMSEELWADVEAELGTPLQWTLRRINLLIRGLDFSALHGCTLQLDSAQLTVRGTTPPCRRMDEQVPGLTTALGNGREGLWATVTRPGTINVGDRVEIIDVAPAPTS
ncbi:MAG: MOSC domain-containing protein [Lentisphaeria bacterium]|jgi:MOSC domain-containing protein YiiM|nr:MOSC domain-containing protein [Lentisphaeria bacterium]MDP7741290.1 MOSC domain-containing protein [Lentisphaeria bacterium]